MPACTCNFILAIIVVYIYIHIHKYQPGGPTWLYPIQSSSMDTSSCTPSSEATRLPDRSFGVFGVGGWVDESTCLRLVALCDFGEWVGELWLTAPRLPDSRQVLYYDWVVDPFVCGLGIGGIRYTQTTAQGHGPTHPQQVHAYHASQTHPNYKHTNAPGC